MIHPLSNDTKIVMDNQIWTIFDSRHFRLKDLWVYRVCRNGDDDIGFQIVFSDELDNRTVKIYDYGFCALIKEIAND